MAHDWIENYADYEGVFHCTNELASFDTGTALRAFQTFHWDDATTGGNDTTFVHAETGVMVRYDGQVVAIEFGDGVLSQAFPDLFAVLHGLGWRTADLYHRPETIDAMLMDVGRAIPALMELDVRKAAIVTDIANFAEGASMVAKGKALLAPGVSGSFNQTALAALESMAEENPERSTNAGAVSTTPAVSPVSGGVTLEGLLDDEPGADQEYDFLKPSRTPPAQYPRAVSHSGSGEEPRAFTLPPKSSGPESQAQLLPEPDALDGAARGFKSDVAQEVVPTEPGRPPVTAVVRQLHVERQPSKPAPHADHATVVVVEQPLALDSRPSQGHEDGYGVSFVVGRSAFCFDFPEAEVSLEEVNAIANELNAREVVHLWPGRLNGTMRWDALGEVEQDSPWFAEQLAVAMGCEAPASAWVAGVMLSVKKKSPAAQIRDVLLSCGAIAFGTSGQVDKTAAEDLSEELMPLKMFAMNNLAGALQAFFAKYAGLLMCEPGAAFVDLSGAVGQEAEVAPFTIRGALKSGESKVYVIHVDRLDGPFVRTTAGLMRFVAESYAKTNRHVLEVEAAQESARRQIEQEAVSEKVTEAVGGLLNQLQAMGIKVKL